MGNKPDFLIAGVQKAGTTALSLFLRQHDEIYMPERKELHYFDHGSDLMWASRAHTNYENTFANKAEYQKSGEATPIYIYWPKCLERISEYNPEIKLVVILRNPCDRAFSHWSMETARNRDLLSFSEAIREGRERVVNDQATLDGHHRLYSYVERGLYSTQVEKIKKLFSAHNYLFLKHDDMVSDLESFLDKICEFLTVRKFKTYPTNEFVRPVALKKGATKMLLADRQYLNNLYRDDLLLTQSLTGLDLSDWLSQAL